MSRARNRVRWLGALVVSTVVLIGCSSGEKTETPTDSAASDPSASIASVAVGRPAPSIASSDAPTPSVAGTIIDTPPEVLSAALPPTYTVTPPDFAIVARATVPKIDVYRNYLDTKPFASFTSPLDNGTPLTFLVDAQSCPEFPPRADCKAPHRVLALLPMRPNGTRGWIDVSNVRLRRNDFRVEVSLGNHRLTVFKGRNVVLADDVGVGQPSRPTPVGRFYIKELLRPPDPDGFYGPFAYGLSGTSETLFTWKGGEPQLGIHGTNAPEKSIGKDVSSGCIRMRNESIRKLAEVLPLGTPVIVGP